jgi:hypothetical protein
MKLESSPNDLLLDLLGYFNVIHLYRAFHGLNLLINHFPSFHRNLKSIFITDYLPKLKVFELIMSIKFRQSSIKESEVDESLDSFRTLFWLVQNQWFVRCDWTGASDIRRYLYSKLSVYY